MHCPRCQGENREGRRFCAKCGTSLAVACPSCGFSNQPGEEFCGGCGQAFELDAAPRFASPQVYTPKHLAEKILTSRGALEGERKQVTVLFADLKGSMELLANRDPEEARKLLDPVLERMMEAVHRYEGTVNQVMGDGIMALFGAPLAHEDHAVRACYAALRMQESTRQYAESIQRTAGVPIHIRVGLNSGEVVVRSIASDLHMDYTAVGQTTHLAARMEQTAMPGSALVTDDVLRLAEGYVQVKPLGLVQVKGFSEAVQVYELTGVALARRRLEAAAARGLTRFVGRDAELDQLRKAMARAAHGHGQVVAIVGEAGVGKSRLAWEVLHSHETQGWLVLESVSVSYTTATAYLPIIDLLKTYFQIDPRDEPRRIREKLTDRLLALDKALEPALIPLFNLLDVPVEDPAWQALDPPQRRQRTLEAVKRLVLRQSQAQPLLLVFENLHWVDSETQAFLERLVESLPTARLLLLVTYRPEYRHAWGSKTYYTQLRIDPLPPETAEELLEGLLGTDGSLRPLKRLLIERTEGNPFFLEESARALVETKVLAGERGAYRLANALESVQVSPTVQAVLAARIDRLPPEEKRLLQAASVIGKDVPCTLLGAIAELPEEELRQGLTHLQAAEFLYETSLFPELEYTFKHALTHEVAYAGPLHERRRTLHARTMAALETLAADQLAPQYDRLAHHALRGENWEKAVLYLREAGAKAVARSATQEAVAHFEQALTALQHLPESRETLEQAIDLRFDLRPPLLQTGRLQDALAVSREAESIAQRIGDEQRVAHVYTYLINYHYLRGEPDLAIEYGERCLKTGEARGDVALQALARRYMGHCYHAQGQYRQAERILQTNIEALEAIEEGQADAQTSVSYVASTGWLSFALAELGEFDLARRYVDKAQRAADASRHAYSQTIAWTLAGLGWMRRGDLERAAVLLERSLDACRDKHVTVWQPIPSSLLGLALVLLGRGDDGLHLLEQGVTLSEELGVKAYLALWTTHLGEGLLAAGRTERALAVAERALELAHAHKEKGHRAWALRLSGEIASKRDPPDVEAAEASYDAAVALGQELGMRPLVARCHLGLGYLYQRTGDRRKAEDHLAAATAWFHEMDMRLWLEQSEMELRKLGGLLVVSASSPELYDYLKQKLSGEEKVTLLQDRRRGDRRQRAQHGGVQRRRADRRHQPSVDEELRHRPLVIVHRQQESVGAAAGGEGRPSQYLVLMRPCADLYEAASAIFEEHHQIQVIIDRRYGDRRRARVRVEGDQRMAPDRRQDWASTL